MAKGTNWNLWGLVICSSLIVIAPAIGALTTTLFLRGAFQQTSSVEPSEKARTLAEGISESMNATAYGIAVSCLAIVATAVFAVRLYRQSQR